MLTGILLIMMFIALCGSGTGNFLLAHKVAELESNPVEKIEYREIEVVKKAMCECGHPSSMHIEANPDNPNEGGCQQEFFELQGKKTTNSFKCFCVKYVGPEPYGDVFNSLNYELETTKLRELPPRAM